ncbi:MAG: PAS domain-containing protein [Coleofasciculaceae cyanobacterium SM2_1_6]|nr:PAS domain-containing protein [Coleofasciculaceae cyanobacterium SM2_1_6]
MQPILSQLNSTTLSLELLNHAIASSSVGVVIADVNQPKQPLIYCNPAFEKITGYSREEVLGYNCKFLQGKDTDPEAVETIRRALKTQTGCCVTLRNYRKDRTPFWNELTISPVFDQQGNLTHYVGIQSDISEKVEAIEALQKSEANYRNLNAQLQQTLAELTQAQSQMLQTEKMSSLGQVVAGIAHEINNPVGFIHGNVNFVTQYTQELLKLIDLQQQALQGNTPELTAKMAEVEFDFIREDLAKVLTSMHNGTDRIKKIVLSLRNFSRLDEADMKPADIHEGLDNTILLVQHRCQSQPQRPPIQIYKDYANLPLVECYPGQLNQVFLNVINNAIDALEESNCYVNGITDSLGEESRGTNLGTAFKKSKLLQIKISTELVDDWVSIRIHDNGCGVTEEVKKNMFNPFFTTKPIGKGTGLGLSTSYQIVVEKHRGKITCSSFLGKGTEIKIEIPLKMMKTPNQQAILSYSTSSPERIKDSHY